MTRRLTRFWIGIGVSVLACAAPRPQPPELSEAELEQEFDQLGESQVAELIRMRARVRNVSYALATSAARHCGSLSRPRAGAILGSSRSFFGDDLREVVQRTHGLGESLTVVHVVPGGSFDRAGIRPGDVVVSLEGKGLESGGELLERLVRLGTRPSVALRVEREGQPLELDVELDLACPVFSNVANSPLLVPYPRERLIADIPLGLLRFTESDDVLAVAIGHQFAHALFERPDDDEIASELHADRMGLMLVADAGFDVGVAPDYWEAVAREYPWLIGAPAIVSPSRPGLPPIDYTVYPHAHIAERMENLRAIAIRLSLR